MLTPKEEIDELWQTDEWKKYTKLLSKIELKPITNPLSKILEEPSLKTNTVLDDLFGGGIRKGQLIEFYGTWGSGKTQICFTLMCETNGKIVYIDSEGTLKPERVKQIAEARGKDIKNIDERLLYFQPTDWQEQVAIPHQLPDTDIELIIVDSLLAHFRDSKDFLGRENLYGRQGLIRTHLADLRRLARKHKSIIIITNQITQTPNATPYTPMYMLEQGVGGPSVHHVPDTIIYLRRCKDPLRIARLMDSSEIETGERPFIINAKGIDNVPAPEEITQTTEESE